MKRSSKTTKINTKVKLKKGDLVQVISGSDKAKTGEIVAIIQKTSKVIVKGINLKVKHKKPQQEGEVGEIIKFEAPIHSSNVMLFSEQNNISSRSSVIINDEGKKIRKLKKTGELIK
uniref:Large ribosomal subunit protein uL24c n=1 Tax=Pyropia perforata TaxID=182771 RepID=A0A023I8I5_PYRPE|nr:50S ribosomal protein L24 [Neoporphyra perforata]AGV01101.1 50S ribosomal protein L24 [Neoporphyra perforata]AHB35079.1 50S ribosomal protein L24 [Neoporphyra perforata]AHB35288.1 50S ribosomal protein L24 [Neoporphyra perforata]AIA19450.1 50S ribosomal protein L24 [Neoporphyra perforata]AIA19659.1 50S ribosomal protein L24 [Neoporphyra perforata]